MKTFSYLIKTKFQFNENYYICVKYSLMFFEHGHLKHKSYNPIHNSEWCNKMRFGGVFKHIPM